MNKRLTTDMADANGLQRAIRPTGFFNIKRMAADFCSAQCIMDNTGSLNLAASLKNTCFAAKCCFLCNIVRAISKQI